MTETWMYRVKSVACPGGVVLMEFHEGYTGWDWIEWSLDADGVLLTGQDSEDLRRRVEAGERAVVQGRRWRHEVSAEAT